MSRYLDVSWNNWPLKRTLKGWLAKIQREHLFGDRPYYWFLLLYLCLPPMPMRHPYIHRTFSVKLLIKPDLWSPWSTTGTLHIETRTVPTENSPISGDPGQLVTHTQFLNVSGMQSALGLESSFKSKNKLFWIGQVASPSCSGMICPLGFCKSSHILDISKISPIPASPQHPPCPQLAHN